MPASRRTYIRRRITVFGGLLVVLAAAVYLPLTLLAPIAPVQAKALPFEQLQNPAVELAWPGYGASAIGAVGFPGVLATGGEETPRAIASISKIVTALVALEAKPLGPDESGPSITMTAHDAALYHSYFARNGKVEPVRAGLVLTERQLLEIVLVSSANNYAESLATWAYGSLSAFLDATRTWLDAHGLHNTTIVEPTGMSPDNRSTAGDLVELGKLALAEPVLAEIVGTKSTALPYLGTVSNTNKLLGVDGITGIKTGTLEEAGACLLFSGVVTVGETPVTIVGTIIGGRDHPSLDRAVRALLASAKAGFREVPLVTAGTPFYSYSTPWEQEARAVAAKDESVLVWAGTRIEQSARAEDVRAAGAGDRVGSVTFRVGGDTIEVPLALDATLADPDPWWRLTHPFG